MDGGNRWEADFSVAKEITSELTGSLSLGYGWDPAGASQALSAYRQNGFQALVRLAWTPDTHTRALSYYDSRSQTGELSATRTSETQGVGSWTATANATVAPNDQDAVSGSVTYIANRADVMVNHSAGLTGIGYDGINGLSSTEERTSVSVASSLVFADGAWGTGRPVTNGFAVVTPHQDSKAAR